MSVSHDKEVISPVALREIVIDDFTTLHYSTIVDSNAQDYMVKTGGTMLGGSRLTFLKNSQDPDVDTRNRPVTLDIAGTSG